MTLPLVVLASFSVVAGLVGLPGSKMDLMGRWLKPVIVDVHQPAAETPASEAIEGGAVPAEKAEAAGLSLEEIGLMVLSLAIAFGGLALGFTVGRGVRDVASTENGRTHAAALRLLLYPPALLTATSLVALTATGGRRGVIGVVVTAFLSYWAGLDVAVGAVPLMEGKDYAFERRIAPDDDEARPDERDLWDRF